MKMENKNLDFVKIMHQNNSVAVGAVLSEVSRCSLEIFDWLLFFFCFIFENTYSQIYRLPKNDDIKKLWLWSIFLSAMIRLMKVQ